LGNRIRKAFLERIGPSAVIEGQRQVSPKRSLRGGRLRQVGGRTSKANPSVPEKETMGREACVSLQRVISKIAGKFRRKGKDTGAKKNAGQID